MSGDSNIEVITGEPAPVRRGLPRRWVVLIVVGALLLAAAAVYGLDTQRRRLVTDRAARAARAARTPAARTPAAQTPAALRKVGGPVPTTGPDPGTGLTLNVIPPTLGIVGGRAIGVALSTNLHLWVSGMDLSTGDSTFPPVDLGQWQGIPALVDPFAPFSTPMYAYAQGVVLLVEPADTPHATKTLMVVDPASGRLRWATNLGPYWHPFADTLVVADPSGARLRGLDWGTGSARWELPMSAGAHYATVAQGGGELTRRLSTPYAATTDSRLFETDPDGTLTVYDVSTGRQLDRRPGTAPPLLKPADQLFAFVSDETLYRVWPGYMDGYDLRQGKVTAFFTAPPNRHIVQTTPCGTGRLCIQVQESTPCSGGDCVKLIGPLSGDPLFLDMVQASDLGILWEQPDMAYGAVEASGDRILADGTELFDRDGHRLLVHPDTTAAWVSPDALLLFDDGGPSLFLQGATSAEVTLADGATGRQTSIGTLDDVIGRCAIDGRTLVCPAIEGLYAWGF